MKGKRIWIACLLCLSLVVLNGCTEIEDMTDEQGDMIAEYSAGVLLRYSDKYERRLITDGQEQNKQTASAAPQASVIPETTPASPSVTLSPTPAANGKSPVSADTKEVSLNAIYNTPGLTFSYHDSKFCKQYPKRAGVSQIVADRGEKLFVISFKVKNISGKDKKVNLMKRKINYVLSIDGSEYQPGISILANGGLNYLNTTIKKGKSQTAVLVFRVSSSKEKASQMNLSITEGKKSAAVHLR